MPTDRLVIGIDESGKGDFFGPLVIGALLAPDSATKELEAMGVRDSKKISDGKIRTIASELIARFPSAVVVVSPEEYNDRYDKIRNLNKLLAWGHAEAIERIVREHAADLAISDKFGKIDYIDGELRRRGCDIQAVGYEKGERILQVAAASILARSEFVNQMQKLSADIGYLIPKGAGPPVDKAGREIVAANGTQILRRIAKLHFKNYTRATDLKLI
ncbi:MAG: ribonuclease HIII [bacterium]|nr:ribonuclease HIII [bacterium]